MTEQLFMAHEREGDRAAQAVSICWGVNRRFIVYARRSGERRYRRIGKPTRSMRVALIRLADAFASGCTRGKVSVIADYYEPIAILEAKVP